MHDDGGSLVLYAGGSYSFIEEGDAYLARWGGCTASPWIDLGGGTAGIAGIPALALSGSLQPETDIGLHLSLAPPSTLALVFVSASSSPVPFLGGTLHPFPYIDVVLVGTDASGELHGFANFPGAASGQGVWFQVALADASVPLFGASLSNAVMGTVP